MKTIKIAHLYYDLMNLYGENGNTRVLCKKLEEQKLKVLVHFLSIDDEIDFSLYDIFYIGSGSEENAILVLEHLKKYQSDLKNAILEGKFFIVTGNALELFGNKIIDLDDNYTKTLGIFDYDCKITDFRIIGEQVYTCPLIEEKVIGFQNRNTVINNYKNNLFEVINGTGYKPKVMQEGILEKHFYGTYLLGPLLVRNPYFLDEIAKEIVKTLNLTYKTNKKDDVSYKAYHEYIKNFVEN